MDQMNTKLNIVARRIFNKLSEDISGRRGLKQEWSAISPNVMKLEIRSAWEQIFTEEVEKHASTLQPKANEPTKTEVTAEDWLKATSIELCKVADHFLALRQNTMEVVSAATKVNIDSIRLEGENVDLRARVKRLEEALEFGVGLNRVKELMSDNHIGDATELVKRTKEVPCPDCYGGHFKPCNICGDSGVALLVIEQKESKP